jgi:hypothetical protein
VAFDHKPGTWKLNIANLRHRVTRPSADRHGTTQSTCPTPPRRPCDVGILRHFRSRPLHTVLASTTPFPKLIASSRNQQSVDGRSWIHLESGGAYRFESTQTTRHAIVISSLDCYQERNHGSAHDAVTIYTSTIENGSIIGHRVVLAKTRLGGIIEDFPPREA